MVRRVVVTGLGLITPLGHDVDAIWKRMLNGESGVGRITLFDASNFATQIAAEVKNWDVDEIGENLEDWKNQDRHTKFGVGAAYKAMKDAGLLGEGAKNVDPDRFGVYTGAGEGEQNFDEFSTMMLAALDDDGVLDEGKFIQKGIEILDPDRELEQEPNMPAAHIAAMFNARGPNVNTLTACAAGAQAIGEAVEIIRREEADVMLAGGTNSMINPFGITGFNLLTALSTENDEPEKASKPFDKRRSGFIIGEGAGMVVLEDLEHAQKRGAKIYGEIAGYGSTSDAYRLTDIHPEGRGAISCMKLALQDAGVRPEDVDYINAHGTSTSVNDRVESLAIRQVFGKYAYQIPVSSTKSMTGHLITAAGSTECIYCLLAIRDNMAPPTINFEVRDPDCDLDYVPNVARRVDIDVALSNSFGFGGQDVSLVIRRFVE